MHLAQHWARNDKRIEIVLSHAPRQFGEHDEFRRPNGRSDFPDSISSFNEFPAVGFYAFAQGILFRKRRQEFVD